MANVNFYQYDIEACNFKLLDALAAHATSGESVKISDIIASYAYDVLFATTTSQPAGFLDHPKDVAKVVGAMRDWKFHCILYGSYLRFHPLNDAMMKHIDGRGTMKAQLLQHIPADLGRAKAGVAARILKALGGEPSGMESDVLPACLAMVAAGTDPLITHLTSSLFYIYRDPKLLQELRAEIVKSHIGQPPYLKTLLKFKHKLSLLHVVMKESLRLHQPHTTGFSYIAPEGGVMIGKQYVPQGVSHPSRTITPLRLHVSATIGIIADARGCLRLSPLGVSHAEVPQRAFPERHYTLFHCTNLNIAQHSSNILLASHD